MSSTPASAAPLGLGACAMALVVAGCGDRSRGDDVSGPDPSVPALELAMTSPANGATVSATITLAASVAPSADVALAFYRDDGQSALNPTPLTSPPFQISFDTRTLPNGGHSFWAQAQSALGSVVSNRVSVNVANVQSNGCTPIAAIAVSMPFDPLPVLEQARVASGPFAGGYLVAPADARLNWYFANLGLLGFVDALPANVKAYLDLYLAHTNQDFTISDVRFDCPEWTCPSLQAPDSHDSYAATLLSLAARYYAVTCDRAWLAGPVSGKNVTVVDSLKSIATNNLLAAQWPNGLVHVFQREAKYPVALLMDNAEAYRGLADLAALLEAIGDASAPAFAEAAARLSQGIAKAMYAANVVSGSTQLNQPGFYWHWQHDATDAAFTAPAVPLCNPLSFYAPCADGSSQVFPQAYRVGLASASYASAWSFLDAHFSYTAVGANGETDPWTILGWAAALQGNIPLAQTMQTKTVATYRAGIAVPIHDWSFYRRISLYLQNGILY